MSTRYNRSDLESAVRQLDVEAKLAGLLPMDHRLGYAAGNQSNGISAQIWTFDADGKPVHGSYFVPEFTYKTGRTEQYKRIEAALNVFFAMRRMREEAERAERIEERLLHELGEL